MTITKKQNGTELTISIVGSLDSTTHVELDKVLEDLLKGITSLIIDFSGVDYVSSAGLRSILVAQKTMNAQGSMVIKNVNSDVMDIFTMTGFVNFLTIE